jgi:hypothetical protein
MEVLATTKKINIQQQVLDDRLGQVGTDAQAMSATADQLIAHLKKGRGAT